MARQKANTEKISVFFSADVLEKLKSLSSSKGTSVSGLIRMIVIEYLAREEK